MEFPGILIFVGIAVLVAVGVIYGIIWERRRREAFRQLAARLGMRFSARKDYALATRFGFLDKLAKGHRRYAFNVLTGSAQGLSGNGLGGSGSLHVAADGQTAVRKSRRQVAPGDGLAARSTHVQTGSRSGELRVFDYHYETYSTDSKGRRQTHHHYFSCFVLTLPRGFPELTVSREGIFSKVAQAFGYDDIDFESHEFSRNFCVRSKDKKFAYDFCNARMIDYLLANKDLNLEVDQDALALLFDRRLSVSDIEPNIQRLQRIRELMPDYLFASH